VTGEGATVLVARGFAACQGAATGGGGQGRGAMKSLLGHYGSRARTLRAGWPTRGYVHERARGIARRLALQSAGWGKTVR
jgi:hypothetical protein